MASSKPREKIGERDREKGARGREGEGEEASDGC